MCNFLKPFIKYSILVLITLTSLIATTSFADEFELVDGKCAFCMKSVLEKQAVLRGNEAITMVNIAPATKGHLMVMPRRDVTRFEDLNKNEMEEIRKMINLCARAFKEVYNISDYLIIQKNGKLAGQHIAHIHFHVIPSLDVHSVIKETFNVNRASMSDDDLKRMATQLREYFSISQDEFWPFTS